MRPRTLADVGRWVVRCLLECVALLAPDLRFTNETSSLRTDWIWLAVFHCKVSNKQASGRVFPRFFCSNFAAQIRISAIFFFLNEKVIFMQIFIAWSWSDGYPWDVTWTSLELKKNGEQPMRNATWVTWPEWLNAHRKWLFWHQAR